MGHPTDPCGPCGTAEGAPTILESIRATMPGCTFCDRERRNNVWVEGPVDSNGVGGICMLDILTVDQIIGVLQVDEKARADLRTVTSNAELLQMADEVKRLPTRVEGDSLQSEINQNANSIPFYSIFRGQPPFAQ